MLRIRTLLAAVAMIGAIAATVQVEAQDIFQSSALGVSGGQAPMLMGAGATLPGEVTGPVMQGGAMMQGGPMMDGGCSSCGDAGGAVFSDGGCSSCSDASSFGYQQPRGGCGRCGARGGCGCMSELKGRWEHARRMSERAAARNAAWPKPFGCADRQIYFAVWEPMIDSGFQSHCTFEAKHFDPETNELNRMGKTTLSGYMKNIPEVHRKLFVQRSTDGDVDQMRMASIKTALSDWFGHLPSPALAMSDRYPMTSPGGRIQSINEQWIDGTPPPVIPVASGTGSTSDTGQ